MRGRQSLFHGAGEEDSMVNVKDRALWSAEGSVSAAASELLIPGP